MLDDIVKEQILEKYLNSGDFNGLPFNTLAENFKTVRDAKEAVARLVKDGAIDIIYNTTNPHIKGFDFSAYQEQFLSELLNTPDDLKKEIIPCGNIKIEICNKYGSFCLYPTKRLLSETVGYERKYLETPPFTKKLCFGECQLDLVYFRVDVLDRYIEDPRYYVSYDDYFGRIYFKEFSDEHPDDIYLKYFGLAYNITTGENLICALLCDLHKLNARHQYHFYSYMEESAPNIIPEENFFKNQILGEYAEEHSIFEAFLEEIKIINKMSNIICNANLFLKEFSDEDRKKLTDFHPFLKPTQKTFEYFCQTLDKLFSDNLDIKVILKLNELYGSQMQIDYKQNGEPNMGSIALLKLFLHTYFKPRSNEEMLKNIFNIWDKRSTGIRAIRSKASHHIRENHYDLQIFQTYKETIREAYKSIRLIRLILSNHPDVKNTILKQNLKIPDWLFEGKIKTYFISPIDKTK